MADAEVRVAAAHEGLGLHDVVAVVGGVAEHGPVGAGEAVPAPVVEEQAALVAGRVGRVVIAEELRVRPPGQLEGRAKNFAQSTAKVH